MFLGIFLQKILYRNISRNILRDFIEVFYINILHAKIAPIDYGKGSTNADTFYHINYY